MILKHRPEVGGVFLWQAQGSIQSYYPLSRINLYK